MEEDIKLVDLVIELVDARAPMSSRNPDIDKLSKNKGRMVLLNKSDLADSAVNARWIKFFEDRGITVVEINARNGKGLQKIQAAVQQACKEKIERDRKRGIINRPVRAMVVGIPNVGKSTFINSFAGKACAKTGNRPGVTKGKQWIKLNKALELLDTPGILWPKFEDQNIGRRLAFIGSINDEIIQTDEMAIEIIDDLRTRYPGRMQERYGFEERGTAIENLEEICEVRKCYGKGETKDLMKASGILIDDFRSGKLGRITLETPEDWGKEADE